MIGRVYLERGKPVTVVARWAIPVIDAPAPAWLIWLQAPRPAPRNVLIERPGGQLVVRPFRGLRKPVTDPGRAGER